MPNQDESSFGDSVYVPVPLPTLLGGAVPDQPPDLLEDNQAASALNFLITGGVVSKRLGYQTKLGGDLTTAALALTEFIPYNQSALLVAGTLSGFLYYDATAAAPAWVNVTGTARTGTVSNPVFFTPMRTATSGLRLVSVNGVDPPTWWTGASGATFANVSTAVIGACATVWRSHFVQGDVTTAADGRVAARVQWSALGDPTVWTGTASTGTLDLLDDNATRIMTLQSLRSMLIAYKEQSAHGLFYKGSPFYFVQTLLHSGITLMSRRSVAAIENGQRHAVVTKEGVVVWDSQNVRDISAGRVASTMLAELNWDARETVWIIFDSTNFTLMIGWPTGSNTTPNKVWLYDLIYSSWWEESLPFTSALPALNVFNPPRVVVGHNNGRVYQLFTGFGDTTSGTAFSASLETKLYSFGDERHKGVNRIGAFLGIGTGATTTVTFTKAGVENPVSAYSFDTGNTFTTTAGTSYPTIDTRITNRYMAFRVEHSAAGETVQVHRLVPWIVPRGTLKKGR